MEEALARQLTESSTSTPSWADWDKSVKDLLCVGITAVAALIEVSATMVLAYPEHRAKTKGYEQDPKHQKIQMVVNIVLSLTMVGVYTVGSFFGPVSLSVPAAMASKLVWNMLFLGIVLRMTNFAKEARVGTYILVFSIVAIPGVGPSDQPDLDIIANMTQPAAIVWLSLLSAATLACCAGMVVLKLRPNALPPVGVYAVLLTGQVTSAVVGTSAGKTFALLSGVPLALAFVVNTIVGAVNLLSNVFAATACDQAIFIPLQTLATLLVNCVTGLVVWQEWSVIAVPSTYACVYLLMFEGVYIMSSLDALVLARAYRNTYLFHQATAEIRAGGRKISRAQTVRVMFAQQSNSLKEPRSLVTAATSPPGVLASALDAKGTAAEDKT